MRTIIVITATTAMLFGTTAFAVASDTSHKGKMRHMQNAAPERMARPYADDYYAGPYEGPGAGIYNYSPGSGGYYNNNYYDRDYWNGARGVVPDFSPGPSPYRGTPFSNVAPY